MDPGTLTISLRTLAISGAATLLSIAVGVPIGYVLAWRRFRGRTILLGIVNTGMGMPPVVVGLVVWLVLVRSGPFGAFELIYTAPAMVIAQFLLATPIVIGFATASFQGMNPRIVDLLRVLGAGRLRRLWLLAREARLGLMTAVMAAFGAVVSEVGASMIVGGNLERSTRVLHDGDRHRDEPRRGGTRALIGRRSLRPLAGREHRTHRGPAAESSLMDVRLTDVRFTRAGREVLSIPDLDIRAGRTTAVLGPNGAGKTTLLRLVAGLERPTVGRVLVGGESAERGPRRVSVAFQEEVFLRRSIRENLELGLCLQGASSREARHAATEALRSLRIDALAERRADAVSDGERRRASLARALCLRMPVVLLDEPMAGLDGTTHSRLLDELPQLLGEAGATCVLVTHDPEEAFRLADDLIVLVGGRVLAAGAKVDIAASPMREAVAHTLGYIVLPGGERRVAIPSRSLRLGHGNIEFMASVDAVIDLVSAWDVLVSVGEVRVHVPLLRTATPPSRGDRVVIHAPIAYDLLD